MFRSRKSSLYNFCATIASKNLQDRLREFMAIWKYITQGSYVISHWNLQELSSQQKV